MASLFGTKIKDTYESVLKLIDNLGLTASPKEITDGAGAGSGVFVANDGSLKASDIQQAYKMMEVIKIAQVLWVRQVKFYLLLVLLLLG